MTTSNHITKITGLQPVAGNGLLDRRLFLKAGLSFSTITMAAAVAPKAFAGPDDATAATDIDPASPPWMHMPGAPFSTYGVPSAFESDVVRYPAANQVVTGNGVSWTPLHKLEGMITPNGLHFERHHNGVPQIDPKIHRLLVHEIYGATAIDERHRHRYEVNINYARRLEDAGLVFSGLSPDGELPEIVELPGHPWFCGVQFHPELKSKPFAPHPLFTSFIKAAVDRSRLV